MRTGNRSFIRWIRRGAKKARLLPLLLCLALLLGGCGEEGKLPETVVLTTGLDADEIFSLEGVPCVRAEGLIYLSGLEGEFAENFGKDALFGSGATEGFLSDMEEDALSRLSRVKAMNLMAGKRGVTQDEATLSLCKEAAQRFVREAGPETLARFGADEELLESMYREVRLSEQLYLEITLGVDPEISDDEARVIALDQILIRTGEKEEKEENGENGEGELRSEKEALRIVASEIRREAVSGEQSFEELMAMYNEASEGSLLMDAAEAPPEVLSLSTGEISEVVETGEGFVVYRCTEPVVEGQTEANKERIVEIRRQEVFLQEYEAFAGGLSIAFNEELWKSLCGKDYSAEGGLSFFNIYEEVFSPEETG